MGIGLLAKVESEANKAASRESTPQKKAQAFARVLRKYGIAHVEEAEIPHLNNLLLLSTAIPKDFSSIPCEEVVLWYSMIELWSAIGATSSERVFAGFRPTAIPSLREEFDAVPSHPHHRTLEATTD